jgi:hypothetical protein
MTSRVRSLTQEDHGIVRSYLDKDPLFNIHMIYGLQTYGFDSQHAEFWGAFGGDGLEGILFTDVLLADYDSSPRFGCLTGDNPQALARLGKLSLKTGTAFVKGKSAHIQLAAGELSPRVRNLRLTRWNFYRADPGQSPLRYGYPVQVAARDDIPALLELYKNSEFGRPDLRHVEFEVQKAVERSTCFFVELEGRVVSASMIAAETDRAGIMNYATTLPEYRGRGLHLCIRTACCEYLFGQGKVALGVFSESNDAMHSIVGKYGSIIGKWSIVYFTRKPPLRRRILPSRLRKVGSSFKNRILHLSESE